MGKSEATILWMIIVLLFLCNLIIPYVAIGLGEEYTSHNLEGANPDTPDEISFGDLLSLGSLSVLLVPFWTISAPSLMQLFIFIPIRIFGWILAIRLARGVG